MELVLEQGLKQYLRYTLLSTIKDLLKGPIVYLTGKRFSSLVKVPLRGRRRLYPRSRRVSHDDVRRLSATRTQNGRRLETSSNGDDS